jgi:hypothetical protein
MNKSVILILLGVLTVVFAESSLKRDKDTLIKGGKEITSFHLFPYLAHSDCLISKNDLCFFPFKLSFERKV